MTLMKQQEPFFCQMTPNGSTPYKEMMCYVTMFSCNFMSPLVHIEGESIHPDMERKVISLLKLQYSQEFLKIKFTGNNLFLLVYDHNCSVCLTFWENDPGRIQDGH